MMVNGVHVREGHGMAADVGRSRTWEAEITERVSCSHAARCNSASCASYAIGGRM